MDIKEQLNGIKADLETYVDGKAKEIYLAEIKSLEDKITALEGKDDSEALKDLETKAKDLESQIEKLDVKLQKVTITPAPETKKSFNEVLAETIEANADKFKGLKKEFGQVDLEMKVAGDMSIANNFPTASTFTQDIRTGMIMSPYNRVWLGDILPGGSSNGSSLVFPKENGGEGGAAVWDGTGDKAQMDFDITKQSVDFSWIAGYLIVPREMLDDIPWLSSYLQNRMLISLKTAENAYILNRALVGLIPNATAYNGTFTAGVDRIIDAGYGQIVTDTFDFYAPTHTILNPREAVKIGLNKATGSGEYDLPQGSVAFANGKLQIGGLDTVPTTSMAANKFLTLDSRATSFVKRLNPELRMFEDATLAKQNKVMFRIEERVGLAVFNNKALVTGDITPAP